MSSKDTEDYAYEVASYAINPFSSQVSGSVLAPMNDDNSRLFSSKGGASVILGNATRSAVVMFDPEGSLRNGQLRAIVYERNAADTVVAQQTVPVGRASSDFLAAGVCSAGMKVANTSGIDTISGTQTAGVLLSVPRDVTTMSGTDLTNFSLDHERDLAMNVVSRDDSTMTVATTPHFGSRMSMTRTNTNANVIRRSHTSSTVVGENMIADNGTVLPQYATVADALAGSSALLALDTGRLGTANNPLTLATYSADISMTLVVSDTDAPNASGTFNIHVRFKIVALDAANNVLDTDEVYYSQPETLQNQNMAYVVQSSLASNTSPIHRIIVYTIDIASAAALTVSNPTGQKQSAAVVTAFEECSDIPVRPIHFCILEGVNAGASLSINAGGLIAGVPDSDNAFISTGLNATGKVVDSNLVGMFLKSVARSLPRAYTLDGHGAVERQITGFFNEKEMSLALRAMSFDTISRAVKKTTKLAKKARKAVSGAVEVLEPFLEAGGAAAMATGTPMGVGLGSAALGAGELAKEMRRAKLLE